MQYLYKKGENIYFSFYPLRGLRGGGSQRGQSIGDMSPKCRVIVFDALPKGRHTFFLLRGGGGKPPEQVRKPHFSIDRKNWRKKPY